MNNYNDKIKAQNVLFVSCLLYLACPLLGLLILLTFILSRINNKNKKIIYLFFFLLSLYLGLINSSKIPVTDQLMYYEAYNMVPQRNILENLMGIYGDRELTPKEMGFGLLNLIGYYITMGNYPLFITLFTVLLYMLYFDAIYKWFYYIHVQQPVFYIISAILILAFFIQFFNLTIHLQRQMLATAVVVHAIIQTVIKDKVAWSSAILSLTLHTSVGIFLPLFIFYSYIKKLSLIKILSVVGFFIFLMAGLSTLATSLTSIIGVDMYALNRLEGMNNAGREDAMPMTLVMLISFPLTLISLKNIHFVNKYKIRSNEIVLYVFYFFLISFSAFNPNNTMQYRYFMMSYGFIPFILPVFFRKLNQLEFLYLLVLPVFLILRFYFTFESIPFTYAPLEIILFGNIYSLFNYNLI